MSVPDGLVLMYVKGGTIYPVAMTTEDYGMWQFIQKLLPQPIKIITDRPAGKAVNLIDSRNPDS